MIRAGHPASILWIAAVLLLATFLQAMNDIAIVITALGVLAVVWIAFAAGITLQAATAVGLVWWLLIGGALDSTIWLVRAKPSDAWMLGRRTWVPAIVWHGIWATIGVVCLWKGGRALLAI